MKRITFFFLLLISTMLPLHAQVYSNMESGKKNVEVKDSLKQADYPYVLPIWGDKATKAGFSLPYSAGVSTQYIWQESSLVIENLKIGFNHGEMHDLAEVVRFNDATSNGQVVNLRPDIWLFPFLNVYGIFARSELQTSVDFGIWVPDADGNWSSVSDFATEANFEATSMGLGLTPTIGIGGGWMALDMNFTWNDIPELEEPAFAFIFGPRFGKSFKLKKPESNIAFWVGGFRLKLNTGTSGSLNLNELFDMTGIQGRVDQGIENVNQKHTDVENWWNGLTPPEQANPINKAKHDRATSALNSAGEFLNGIDEALNDENQATVQYSLDKRPKDMWNFVLGTQYQYNRHWMLRFETGFLASRTQVIAGLQYRFGL
jgi:hypothetical protein